MAYMKAKLYFSGSLSKWLLGAMIAVGGLTACEGYDLAEEDPSWLGSSIYEYLQDNGNYTNMVRIIDDLGYRDVLAKTGSKTLFVGNDDAFGEFYKKNNWGVHSYDQLSLAQKKIILFGSMINNSCQVAYLSSSEGPTEGDCMRRKTSSSAYDSVPVLTPSEMPDNPYWARYRKEGKPIVCMSDITTKPMIHFVEAFLENKLITNPDCNFLFNYETERQPGDANVNGVLMTEQNIKCSNGFIHGMQHVLTPLPNMADLITYNPHTQGYAKLLNRFCAPYYAGDEATREYNRLYNANIDSLFEKRYFSERSQGGQPLDLTPDEGPVNGLLKFDPAWNQFYSATTNSTSANVALQENMGVMLVPSDEALNRYWNEGAGKVLKDYYGSWENVPDKVISKMINVNMLNSFTNSVPSKFSTVLNDANDELGLETQYVDSVLFACNGAVYLTNKVFNPVAYISVTFPALVNETMNILYWGVEQNGFELEFNFPIITEHFDSVQFFAINTRQRQSRAEFTVERDSLNLRRYILRPKDRLMPGFEYQMKLPYRAFRDINGFWSDSTVVKVSLPSDETLSSLDLELSGVDRKLIVDLLGEKRDKVLRSFITEQDGTLHFPYIKAGRYSIRITEDRNRNAINDTGSLLERRQPELVVFLDFSGSPYLNIPASAELTQSVDVGVLFH